MSRWIKLAASPLCVALALAAASCKHCPCHKADAVSGATVQKAAKKVVLPPSEGDYKVLGELPGLKNFAVAYDNVFYRGGEPCGPGASKSLKAHGIKTIISVTPTDREREWCRREGFELVEIPFEKCPGPTKEDLDRLVGMFQGGNGPFYVHCHGGTHRGGALGLAYRMHVKGWPREKALLEYGFLGGDLKGDYTMINAVTSYRKGR